MANLQMPQSGTMCERCTPPMCRCQSTLSMADSLVRISASQVVAPAWMESEADFFSSCCDLSMRFDRDSYSWKTSLGFDSTPTEFSENWPAEGLMLAGCIFQRLMSARPIVESAGGAWPTPTARLGDSRRGMPSADTAEASFRQGKRNLDDAVAMWPTPTVKGNHNRKGASPTSGDGLAVAVAKFPTPRAIDGRSKGNGPRPDTLTGATTYKDGERIMVSTSSGEVTGKLNPRWVDWLMGYPIDWTACRPWATPLSRKQPEKRFKSSQVSNQQPKETQADE